MHLNGSYGYFCFLKDSIHFSLKLSKIDYCDLLVNFDLLMSSSVPICRNLNTRFTDLTNQKIGLLEWNIWPKKWCIVSNRFKELIRGGFQNSSIEVATSSAKEFPRNSPKLPKNCQGIPKELPKNSSRLPKSSPKLPWICSDNQVQCIKIFSAII